MVTPKEKYDNLINSLSDFKKEISIKSSEKKNYKQQIVLIDKDLIKIKDDAKNLCKDIVSECSDYLLDKHIHFQEKHIIDVKTTYYYDTDWFRNTYGTRNPHDSYGMPYDYEGPDRLMYVICKECINKNIINVIESPCYSNSLINIDINLVGQNVLKETILKKIKNELIEKYILQFTTKLL